MAFGLFREACADPGLDRDVVFEAFRDVEIAMV